MKITDFTASASSYFNGLSQGTMRLIQTVHTAAMRRFFEIGQPAPEPQKPAIPEDPQITELKKAVKQASTSQKSNPDGLHQAYKNWINFVYTKISGSIPNLGAQDDAMILYFTQKLKQNPEDLLISSTDPLTETPASFDQQTSQIKYDTLNYSTNEDFLKTLSEKKPPVLIRFSEENSSESAYWESWGKQGSYTQGFDIRKMPEKLGGGIHVQLKTELTRIQDSIDIIDNIFKEIQKDNLSTVTFAIKEDETPDDILLMMVAFQINLQKKGGKKSFNLVETMTNSMKQLKNNKMDEVQESRLRWCLRSCIAYATKIFCIKNP